MLLPLHPHEIAGATVYHKPRRHFAQNRATAILGRVMAPIRPREEGVERPLAEPMTVPKGRRVQESPYG